MDHHKLIKLISENPQLWDHGNDQFRNQHLKVTTWNAISAALNVSVQTSREVFKALREKYIRERSKHQQLGESYRKWELYDMFKFLDPHIIIRRSSTINDPLGNTNENRTMNTNAEDPNCKKESTLEINSYDVHSSYDFCRGLIRLVHQSQPLWDREHRDNHDKDLKFKLWNTIAKALKADPQQCILKWKGLREKYIRQKQKYTEGRSKWEFLDELSFLDSVIQYRRKHWQMEESSYYTNDSRLDQGSSECDTAEPQDASLSESEIFFNLNNIKTEGQQHAKTENYLADTHVPDSSTILEVNRKRRGSETSEVPSGKKDKHETKTPEQIFGELVASMLATKSDSAKRVAMMEIMQILTRS